ncbi:ABC transporter permease [Halonotius aquaticus]|nr:ABC transporter permease [Halonotius aquaticus]
MAQARTRLAAALSMARDRVGTRTGLLVLPVVGFELVVFAGALGYLLRMSFYASTPDGLYQPGTWTVTNYTQLLTDSYLQGRLLFSLQLGAVVTAITLVVGFIYAYAAWRASGRFRAVLLGAVLVELLISIVIKVYAWVPLLAPNGTFNSLLVGSGLAESPVALLGNGVGVVIGLVYSMLPYVVLAVYAVLTSLDWSHVEAARDLGASRPRSVLEVVVPQAVPGLLAGGITAFSWSTVAFAAPSILGSPSERTVASEAGRFVNTTFDWPRAAALGIEAVVVVVLVIGLAVALVRRFGPADTTEGVL